MMQEVSTDESNNGDSTFEFVDSKIDESHGNGAKLTDPLVSSTTGIITPQPMPQHQPAQKSEISTSDSSSRSPMEATIPLYNPGASFPVISPLVLKEPSHVVTSPPTSQSIAFDVSGSEAAGMSGEPNSPNSISSSTGMWGWIKGNQFLNKVAEKAKNSVDSIVTTLDPQMKELIYSGGDIDIVVACDHEAEASGIREAFQSIFGRATVQSADMQVTIVPQPVGFSAGLQGAKERVHILRKSGKLAENQPVVAVENFIVEITPERWYDIACLVLDDPAIEQQLHIYSQATLLPLQVISLLQQETPADYDLKWAGYAVKIENVIGKYMNVENLDWRQTLSGVSRKDVILMASKVLATQYKFQKAPTVV